MISDAENQSNTPNTKSLLKNEFTVSNDYQTLQTSHTIKQKLTKRKLNNCCCPKFPNILVILLWLVSLASLFTIICLYSQKKKILLRKMQTLYLIGITIISLMDICLGLIAILFLCSNFRFKQVFIFTNILKIAGFAMLIFDYAELQDKIHGYYPDFFLVNLYIECFSSLLSFILLFYFIIFMFRSN